MHHKTHALIRQIMSNYIKKGKKSTYKQKQIKRLIAIIDDVFENEKMNQLDAIGRKQLIGYWRRTENQTEETRRAKYTILKKFFELYNAKVTVPIPKAKN